MKIADVLRKLADTIEQEQDPGRPDPQLQNPAELLSVPTGPYGSNIPAPENKDQTEDELMIPPLQLKMELLKRAVDVDNVYDPGEARADQAHDNPQDPIAVLRKNAGVPMAAVMELSNDEPLDD